MKTKFLFITGGVISSLGKGIIAASIAAILKDNNFKVFVQKFDPYLNVDPGTLSPYEHGEVFVTKDGAETDLDLGHYERFIASELNKHSNVTSGKIYWDLLNDERAGKLRGKTAQAIPHVTNLILEKIYKENVHGKYDFVITEIGGTVGDIESNLFIEALRQFKTLYPKNVKFAHCSYMPFLDASQELKSKPTQQSIRLLNAQGIFPDFLFLRSTIEIPNSSINKISLLTGISNKKIFKAIDVDNIYKMPKFLFKQKVGQRIIDAFEIKKNVSNISTWTKLEKKINENEKAKEYKVAIVGKYVELPDAYLSIIESLKLASYENKKKVQIDLLQSELISNRNVESKLKKYSALIIPGGFGKRAIEGKILAIKYAREKKLPFLGLCLGMQLATIEYARNVLGKKDADSIEFNPSTTYPVFAIMDNKNDIIGGTLRLGNYEAILKKNSHVYKIYKKTKIVERHRHRYEFNLNLKKDYDSNFVFSGINPQTNLVEFIELKNHPFFIATQAHPEFTSNVEKVNPLFVHLIKALK